MAYFVLNYSTRRTIISPKKSSAIGKKSKPERKQRTKAFALGIVVLVLAGIGIVITFSQHHSLPFLSHAASGLSKNNSGTHDSLQARIYAQLKNMEVRATDIKQIATGKPDSTYFAITISAKVPRGQPLESIVWQLTSCVKSTSYTVTDCVYDESQQQCSLMFTDTLKQQPEVRLIIALGNRFYSASMQLAIVGNVTDSTGSSAVAGFASLPIPVSITLIPSFPNTPEYAQIAKHNNKELLIRLPMEPTTLISSKFPGPVIMLDDTRAAIHSILSEATRAVPGYAGFTNLWGNRVLADSRVMTIILEEMQKKNGYFIETPATKQSVSAKIASALHIPYGVMSLSFRPETSPASIEEQFAQYCTDSRHSSSMILCATITPELSAALKTMLPWFTKNGIKLVYVSDILQPEKQAD
jgi:polysaccharide deacetylase 2 family uncharacterized protein YibQ